MILQILKRDIYDMSRIIKINLNILATYFI